MKQCTKCDQTKSVQNFDKHRSFKDGYSLWCKQCCSSYRKANRHIKAKNQADYRKRHPDRVAANNAKRKAAKLQRTPKWLTKEQWKEINQFYTDSSYLTWYTKTKFEVDHIIPLQGKLVSGLNVPWNLQLLTGEENQQKGNRYESKK